MRQSSKLTVLVFTRNDLGDALGLIKSVYRVADEIVVMDNSDERYSLVLSRAKRSGRLAKVKIFRVFALGYPDPLRMYALRKCSNRWVLLMDTDERLSEGLARDLKGLIAQTNASAFAVRRYEEMKGGRFTGFFTWQVRLMQKDKVLYRGLRHEQPSVRGALEKLGNSDYYIEHRRVFNPVREWGYGKLEKVDTRLSYRLYNRNMLGFIAKLMAVGDREFDRSLTKKIVSSLLLAYEKLTLRRQEDEISNLDYFFYHLYVTLGYSLKQGDIGVISRAISSARGRARQVQRWREEPDSKELFEISKIINEVGVTRFLGLDEEKTVRRIYRRYKGKPQGINLLINLLKERYREGRGS